MNLEDTFPGTSYTLADLTITQTGIANVPDPSDTETLTNLGNLAVMLTNLAASIGPFTVDSAYRSDAVNAAVGGAPGSYHNQGIAADIIPSGDRLLWYSNLANSGFPSQLGEIFDKPSQGDVHVSLSTPEKTAFFGLLDPSTGQYRQLTSAELQWYQSYSSDPNSASNPPPASLHLPGSALQVALDIGNAITGVEGDQTGTSTVPLAMGIAVISLVVLGAVIVAGQAVKSTPTQTEARMAAQS